MKHIEFTITNIDNTFIGADFHFDHSNIIKYCNRPFANKDEMNTFIMNNYNSVIKTDSLYIHVGDMAYGKDSKTAKYWLNQLRGYVLYIKGNHDHGIHIDTPIEGNLVDICTSVIIKVNNQKIYIVHRPTDIPDDWIDWAIHGHKHNTGLFIDRDKKRICVSMELINYTPISLRELLCQTS